MTIQPWQSFGDCRAPRGAGNRFLFTTVPVIAALSSVH